MTGTITMDADRNPIKPAVILKVEGGTVPVRGLDRARCGPPRAPILGSGAACVASAGSMHELVEASAPAGRRPAPRVRPPAAGSVPRAAPCRSSAPSAADPTRSTESIPHSGPSSRLAAGQLGGLSVAIGGQATLSRRAVDQQQEEVLLVGHPQDQTRPGASP